LRQRVKSYFRKSSRHSENILEMLSQASQLEVTMTGSVLEAAILEADEIKRLVPPYNTALRKDGRQVWFCSADFVEFEAMPTEKCRIGPLVFREGVARFAAIRKLIQMGDMCEADEKLLITALGIPAEYAPAIHIISSGIDTFSKRYAETLHRRKIGRALVEIGNQLWRKRLRDKEIETNEPEDFELKSIRVPVWTPESVCRIIESNIVRGTYEIRRARWLVLLSESSLYWEECSGKSSGRFVIVFENGQVLYRRQVNVLDMPVPPGYRKRFEKRQRSFDLMTYDRMRVVTTEIKKIMSDRRRVELRFGPQNVLQGESLVRVFRWV